MSRASEFKTFLEGIGKVNEYDDAPERYKGYEILVKRTSPSGNKYQTDIKGDPALTDSGEYETDEKAIEAAKKLIDGAAK